MRRASFPHQPDDLAMTTRDRNVFRNLFAWQQRMVSITADTHRSRMPLRPVRRRRDEIENLLDGSAYLNVIANARHPQVPPSLRRLLSREHVRRARLCLDRSAELDVSHGAES